MLVRSVELTNFRAWGSATFRFDDRATALLGPNACGKTSVLEAIWYAASLSSHRSSADSVMVRAGETAAVIRAEVERHAGDATRAESIELEVVTQGRARQRLGGAPVGRRRDVLGTLRASIFAPERQAVIRGDPGDRRKFADELLVQLHPRYHGVIREYERALRQRNTLLREHAAGRRSLEGLEAWDEALAGPGAALSAGRARAIAALEPHAREAFERVGGGTSFAVAYLPNVPGSASDDSAAWTASFRERLAARAADERIRGVTLVGPHRDEVEIAVAGLPARTHASHGEGWLAATALVLGGHAAVAGAIAEEPVLLLDDPFTLLDPERRQRLVDALPPDAQVLVTAADPAEVPPSLKAAAIDAGEMSHG
ncbi:MAG TPA: DNA replication/repair protein RecF [Actinomycetota bacterium]